MKCPSFLIPLIAMSAQLSAQDNPSPRSSAHLFYFKPTHSLLLFDGYNGALDEDGKAEIWSWKNGWQRIDSSNQPMRSLSAAAYLPDKQQVFIYGGIGKGGYDDTLRESFSYDGKRWMKNTDVSIGTRDHHEMAYNEADKTIVVFGGENAKREFDTATWILKESKWQSLYIPSPGPRVHHAMAYDAERKKIVLFGGYNGKTDADETWEFDGKSWSRIPTPVSPGERTHHAMVYDAKSKRVILFGGENNMKALGDLWSWDGKQWEKIGDGGPGRVLPALASNPENGKLYVYGGSGGDHFVFIHSDLWEWNGKNWKPLANGKTFKFDMEKNKFVEVKE